MKETIALWEPLPAGFCRSVFQIAGPGGRLPDDQLRLKDNLGLKILRRARDAFERSAEWIARSNLRWICKFWSRRTLFNNGE